MRHWALLRTEELQKLLCVLLWPDKKLFVDAAWKLFPCLIRRVCQKAFGSHFLCVFVWKVPGEFWWLFLKGKPEVVHDAIIEWLAFSKIWAIVWQRRLSSVMFFSWHKGQSVLCKIWPWFFSIFKCKHISKIKEKAFTFPILYLGTIIY